MAKQQLEMIQFSAKASSKKAGIFFHGYGADASDLAPFRKLLDPEGQVDWFFPEGILKVEIAPGFWGRGWFPIDAEALQQAMATGQHRDLSDMTSPDFDQALNVVGEFLAGIEPEYDEFFIGGFSQGGMLLSHAVTLLPLEKVKGAALLSTSLVDKAGLLKKFETWGKGLNFIQSHGKEDPILGLAGARSLTGLLQNSGHKGKIIEFTGGHEIPQEVLGQLRDFFTQQMFGN